MNNKLFLSFSKKDRFTVSQVENLLNNLKIYSKNESPLEVWSMKSLLPGDDYDKEIEQAIDESNGVILALSEEFLNASYIVEKELPLIKRKKEIDPDFKIFPLLIRDCDYHNIDILKNLHIFPSPSKSVDQLEEDFENELLDFAKKILLQFHHNEDDVDSLIFNQQTSLSTPQLASIPWNIIEKYIDKDELIPNLVKGNPNTKLFAGQGMLKYFIPSIDMDEETLKSLRKLKFIQLSKEQINQEDGLSLKVVNKERMEVFYDFVTFINQKLGDGQIPNIGTIKNSVELWRGLLSQFRNQDQLERGLLGELWVLNELINLYGSRFVEYWIGPSHQRHDFRFDNVELEIKTTNSKDRTHTISSVEQLEPTEGSKLYMISILLTSTTRSNSESLNVHDLFLEISEKLDTSHKQHLDALLNDYLIDPDLYRHLNTPYALTDIPKIIYIDDEFPKITLDEFHNLRAHERIRRITYSLNVDNLGEEFNETNIKKVLNS
tara:strand:- start:5878 stop:7353 length:1476 start_codon:yes stop_codon:yes gene_type:complete